MTDPITMATVTAVVLNEGIKFLYEQASELLKARRERKEQVVIAVSENAPLDRPLTELIADLDELDKHQELLAHLAGQLDGHIQEGGALDTTDEQVVATAADLRSTLEAIYGQRLTLAGEEREPSGTAVRVEQVLGTVSGAVTGIKAEVSGDASAKVTQRADEVSSGGRLTGFEGKIKG